VADRITALSFVIDLDDLASKHDQVKAWFAQVMQSLERDGPGSVARPEGRPNAQSI